MTKCKLKRYLCHIAEMNIFIQTWDLTLTSVVQQIIKKTSTKISQTEDENITLVQI